MADGGSVWLDKLDDNAKQEVHEKQLINDYGKFAYLEGMGCVTMVINLYLYIIISCYQYITLSYIVQWTVVCDGELIHKAQYHYFDHQIHV